MRILIQHCLREFDVLVPAPVVDNLFNVDDLFNPRRLAWSDLDAQYTLRMHNLITRDEYLNAILGNWDEL